MKIAIIGGGAIGGLIAGYLKFKGEMASLIVRPEQANAIRDNGLTVTGTRGNIKVTVDVFESLQETFDLVILTVKTQDIVKTIKQNLKFLKNSTILTIQNGVQADILVAELVPREHIISSIVMFGATYVAPAHVAQNFEGPWVIGRLSGKQDQILQEVFHLLKKMFPMVIGEDVVAMKYLKIFLNANNCLPAILGISIQEAFADIEISRLAITIWREGLEVFTQAGIKMAGLPDFPVERLKSLTSMPLVESSRIMSEIMINLSKEPLYGSILQSIKRNRPTEIDYINGEYVRVARNKKLQAPLNERLVEMVHLVERTGKFFSKHHLLSDTKKYIKVP
ncbi:MAG: 2-dehydropantoate 2-reductase [Candidatus Omnitrophota bacterium]|jgi:2-dehydropantoate 2-reductase